MQKFHRNSTEISQDLVYFSQKKHRNGKKIWRSRRSLGYLVWRKACVVVLTLVTFHTDESRATLSLFPVWVPIKCFVPSIYKATG